MLGFSAAASCAVEYGTPPIMCEYGTPTMDFRVSGTVLDSETEKPIENIAVTFIEMTDYERPDTAWTDDDGRFVYESSGFPDESVRLKFTDVDSYENGGYFETVVKDIPLEQISEGSGAWYEGEFAAEEVNVMMKRFEDVPCMYGTPYMEFSIKGRVTDTDERPLQGIVVKSHKSFRLLPFGVGFVRCKGTVDAVLFEPSLHVLVGVALTELIHTKPPCTFVGADTQIFSSPFKGIAEGLKGACKLRIGEAMLDGFVHISPYQTSHRRPSFLLGFYLSDMPSFSSRLLDNRQAVFTANAVGHFTHFAVGFLAIVIAF